jgi:hypothetical protein
LKAPGLRGAGTFQEVNLIVVVVLVIILLAWIVHATGGDELTLRLGHFHLAVGFPPGFPQQTLATMKK